MADDRFLGIKSQNVASMSLAQRKGMATGLHRALVLTAVVLMVDVLVQGAQEVDCVFGRSCVLPCRFQPSTGMVLHWYKNGNTLPVHTYYYNEDHLEKQDPLYEGRTSLFHNQISGGNASLSLARVNLQDQGRYMCYARSNEDTFVRMTVRAPVSRVDILLVSHTVTCKSGGIYPRPELTWSISPHPATNLLNRPEVHIDSQGLYNISGSLRTVDNDTETVYSCSVHNEHSARKATIRQHPPMQSTPNSKVLLPCKASWLYDTTWTFNHSQLILRKQAGQEKPQVEAEWQQHVRELSESGSLLLYVTSSAESEGTYTCTLSNADGTDVTNIDLKILEDGASLVPSHWGIIGVVIALLVIAVGAMLTYLKVKGLLCFSTPRQTQDQPNVEEMPLRDLKPRE